MPVTPTIPITIEPEAAARVAELGMQTHLDQMIQHMTEAVRSLRSIQVMMAPIYDTGDEPEIAIEGTQEPTGVDGGCTSWDLIKWLTRNFPPDVRGHFDIHVSFGRIDER